MNPTMPQPTASRVNNVQLQIRPDWPIPVSGGTVVERKAISIMKACELVGVSRRTIYNWIASGKVEYVRTAGGSIRIFVDSLWREPEVAIAAHPIASSSPLQFDSRKFV